MKYFLKMTSRTHTLRSRVFLGQIYKEFIKVVQIAPEMAYIFSFHWDKKKSDL